MIKDEDIEYVDEVEMHNGTNYLSRIADALEALVEVVRDKGTDIVGMLQRLDEGSLSHLSTLDDIHQELGHIDSSVTDICSELDDSMDDVCRVINDIGGFDIGLDFNPDAQKTMDDIVGWIQTIAQNAEKQ